MGIYGGDVGIPMSGMERSIIRRLERRAQLLGPDGQPIASKRDTEIPFIRYFPPVPPEVAKLLGLEGRPTKALFPIDRGPKVYAEAIQFLSRGGRFGCQITPWGEAHLVAGFPVTDGAEGELALVAEETVPNRDEAIGAAVDRLVSAAVRDMDAVILGESQLETMQ